MAAKEQCRTEHDNDLIVCHRYRLLHKICSGIDLLNHDEVAMKLEMKAKNNDR
ncbi:hypothetical protein LOAG_00041 [Loa loa]|uniref:Uncharacterized protein n=1 Tax=Loa loa TaxID=7209 RepID=A0A1S0UCD3_LOALO|nr:hypothetical protein LOAG_00041 [Loa loa]EFO28445.1 hypothetical protein LOAG_00041 [Loa loa]